MRSGGITIAATCSGSCTATGASEYVLKLDSTATTYNPGTARSQRAANQLLLFFGLFELAGFVAEAAERRRFQRGTRQVWLVSFSAFGQQVVDLRQRVMRRKLPFLQAVGRLRSGIALLQPRRHLSDGGGGVYCVINLGQPGTSQEMATDLIGNFPGDVD